MKITLNEESLELYEKIVQLKMECPYHASWRGKDYEE